MGVCCSIKPEIRLLNISKSLPNFIYLNKGKTRVSMVNNLECQSIEIPDCKVNRNSAIGNFTDDDIIVGGGRKPNGKFSRKVFRINPLTKEITRLSPLKIGVEGGNFYMINLSIYYIASNLQLPHQVLKNNSWEILHTSKLKLTCPAVFIVSKTIYFACGIKPNNKPTKKIYYLDLDNDLKYKVCQKVKFKLYKPVACALSDIVVIAGGKTVDKKHNYVLYIRRDRE